MPPTWYRNQKLWCHLYPPRVSSEAQTPHPCPWPSPPAPELLDLPAPPSASPALASHFWKRRWLERRVTQVLDPALFPVAGWPLVGELPPLCLSFPLCKEKRVDSVTSVGYLAPKELPLPFAPGSWHDSRLAYAHPQVPSARPCASPCSVTRGRKRKLPMAGQGEYAQEGSPGSVTLAAMSQRSATRPESPPGLRRGCLGIHYLLPELCSCSTDTLCAPAARTRTSRESQLSTLRPRPQLSFWKSRHCPRSHTPSTAQRGAIPGNSPGRSTFHLGLFWSMRADQAGSWPPGLAGPAAWEQLPSAWGQTKGMAQWLEEQRETRRPAVWAQE